MIRFAHHSTTFGTRKKLSSLIGAFLTTSSAIPPSFTTSVRFFIAMHPGPMNRGVEIDSIVADGAQSLIREQVEMGVAVRMAVLEALSRNLPNA